MASPKHSESGSWPIDGFLDLGDSDSGIRSWLESAAGEEVLASGYFPIAEAPGGDLYCLAFENAGVAFWDHETGRFHVAAESFDDFIRRLQRQPDSAIDLSTIKLTLDPDLL